MKKTIINRNYSLLVLILLVLYVTYIIIPNNKNMMGGSSPNPFDSMDETKLTDHLMKTDSIFNILNKYYIVYIAINVILVLLSLYFAYFQYVMQGIPVAGVEPKLGWDNAGATFLTDFFLLSRQKLGLNPPNIKVTNPDILNDFDKNANDLVSAQKPGIDLFCNIISPCNICGCTGPDPNYDGDPEDAPIVPYGGAGCVPVETFGVGAIKPEVSSASIINNYKATYDYTHRIFGNGLPNCCCHLFKKYNIPANIDSKDIEELMSKDGKDSPLVGDELPKFLKKITDKDINIRNATLPLGLPNEIGCEPATLGEFTSSDGKTVMANNGNYALAMFQSCLSNKKIEKKPVAISSSDPNSSNEVLDADTSIPNPNIGKTPYAINRSACYIDMEINNKKLASDKGISLNFILRNEKLYNEIKKRRKYLAPSAGTSLTNEETSDSLSINLIPYIGNLKNTWWDENDGPAWPFNFLFPVDTGGTRAINSLPTGMTVSTDYFYTNARGRRIELKIDNYLQEVYANPVKRAKNMNSKINISELKTKYSGDTTITDEAIDKIKEFIEFGLNAPNDLTFMDYSKNPPKERKTASNKRYLKKKTGKFVFP
jgi:hypothetical protein